MVASRSLKNKGISPLSFSLFLNPTAFHVGPSLNHEEKQYIFMFREARELEKPWLLYTCVLLPCL